MLGDVYKRVAGTGSHFSGNVWSLVPMGFCDVPRKNLLDFIRDMKSISVPNEPRYKPLRKIHQAASEGDTERLQRMISLGKHSVHDRDFKER